MPEILKPRVAIVNMGLGNLFSIKQACLHVGLRAEIASSPQDVMSASAVILPGVGAFGKAMDAIRRLDLLGPLKEVASSRPLLGICLGMQLLMTESCEFGSHRGLDIVPGEVRLFEFTTLPPEKRPKVPHVGWNRIYYPSPSSGNNLWKDSMLEGLQNYEYMYFVHSYYVKPAIDHADLSFTEYEGLEFCSSIQYKNVFACQFHPERSGPMGLRIYQNLASAIIQYS